MSGCLIDTNVISELTKASPDSGVVAFLSERDDLWLSPVVVHELEFGLRRLPRGRRRVRIRAALSAFAAAYEDRILPVGRPEAERAAALRAQTHRAGRTLHLGDALIAGTAMARGLSIATRNTGDFKGLAVNVVNPWRTP